LSVVIDGKPHTIAEAAKRFGIKARTLRTRIRRGVTLDKPYQKYAFTD
jgi:DNA-directed RNA polymerase specialized sigma24 family protein